MAVQISDKFKCIFIHIPKTGGSTVEQSVLFNDQRQQTGEHVGGHLTAMDYRRLFPEKFESYYKFSFVRNPYSRLVSAFEYLIKGGSNESDSKIGEVIRTQCQGNFEIFCKEFLNERNIYEITHLIPQYKYLTDGKDDALLTDFIGKQERLDDDATKLFKLFNLEYVPKYIKVGHNRHFSLYYSKETADRIYELYEKDFKLLDYNKDINFNQRYKHELRYQVNSFIRTLKKDTNLGLEKIKNLIRPIIKERNAKQ